MIMFVFVCLFSGCCFVQFLILFFFILFRLCYYMPMFCVILVIFEKHLKF